MIKFYSCVVMQNSFAGIVVHTNNTHQFGSQFTYFILPCIIQHTIQSDITDYTEFRDQLNLVADAEMLMELAIRDSR